MGELAVRRILSSIALLSGLGCGPTVSTGSGAGGLSDEPMDVGPRKLSTTCALDDGIATCFRSVGPFTGPESILRDEDDPVAPADFGEGVLVESLHYYTMMVTSDRRLKMWGRFESGLPEFGEGIKVLGDDPSERGDGIPYIDLGTDERVVGATRNGITSCVWFESGRVRCWGYDYHGQPGAGLVGDEVGEMGDGLVWLDLGAEFQVREVVAFSVGRLCAVGWNGRVKCWGESMGVPYAEHTCTSDEPWHDFGDDPDELGENLPEVELGDDFLAKQVVIGQMHMCALSEAGLVKCWGLGTGNISANQQGTGRLGLEDASDAELAYQRETEMPFVDLGEGAIVKRLAATSHDTCALLDSGRVKCWGANDEGTLGYEDTESRGGATGEMGDNLPFVDLGMDHLVEALASDGGEFCALLDDRSVKCWGTLEHGGMPGTMGDNLEPVLYPDEH